MEYREIKRVKHYVYDSISEFKEEHPSIEPIEDWKKGKEGDWVYSDDNRIVQLLKVKEDTPSS